MSSSDEGTSDFEIGGFGVTLYSSVAVGAALFLYFFFARHIWKWFYTPKSRVYFPEEDWAIEEEVSKSWFYWMWYVYKYPDEKLYQQKGGIDTIIYLRFLKNCIIFFFILSLWGLIAILPVNWSGPRKDLPDDDTTKTTGNNRYSMSNLQQNSPRLYMHLCSIGLFTAMLYYFMYRMYRTGIELNKLEHVKNSLRSRTIMISELNSKASKSNADLKETFCNMYRKQVLMAQAIPRNTKLRSLMEERKSVAKKYFQTCDLYIKNGAKERPVLGPLHILHLDLPKSVWASLQTQQFKSFYSTVIGDTFKSTLNSLKISKKEPKKISIEAPKGSATDLTTFADVSGGRDSKTVIMRDSEADLEMGIVEKVIDESGEVVPISEKDDPRLIVLPGTEVEEEKRHLQQLFLAQRMKMYKRYISKKGKSKDREGAMIVDPEDIERRDIPEDYFESPVPLPEEQSQPHGLDLINFFEEVVYSLDKKIVKKQKRMVKALEMERKMGKNLSENDLRENDSTTSGFDTDANQQENSEEGTQLVHRKSGMTRIGFVTFKYVSTAMAASQSLHSGHKKKFMTRLAPDPKNIIWKNLRFRHNEQFLRTALCGGALFGLFAFYTVPVTAISAITNLTYLGSVDAIKPLVDLLNSNSFLKGVVGSFLPTLALQIFMALLPTILKLILQNAKYYTKTELELGVMKAYWTFLLLNVFLVTSLTGSLFKIINDVLDKPYLLISLLASSLPSQAEFFVEYMIVSTFIQYPFQIANLIDFGVKWAKMWLFCYTENERREVRNEEENFDYVQDFSQELLSFSIGLTYSVMQPIILPFTFLFFCFAHFTQKHQFVFVVRTKFEGYQMLETIITIMALSGLIFHITMTGVFALQLFAAGSIFCILLIIITLIVWYFLHDHYQASCVFVPIRHCSQEKLIAADDIDEIARMYRDPCLKHPESLYESIRHLRTDEEIEVEPEEEANSKSKFKIGQAKQAVSSFVGSVFKKAVNQTQKLENMIVPMGSLEKAMKKTSSSKGIPHSSSSPKSEHSPSRGSFYDRSQWKEESDAEEEVISESSDED